MHVLDCSAGLLFWFFFLVSFGLYNARSEGAGAGVGQFPLECTIMSSNMSRMTGIVELRFECRDSDTKFWAQILQWFTREYNSAGRIDIGREMAVMHTRHA